MWGGGLIASVFFLQWCCKLGSLHPFFLRVSPPPSGWMGNVCATVIGSLQRCSIRFKAGLWLWIFTEWFWSQSFKIWSMCFGSLNRRPNLRTRALRSRFSSRMSRYIVAFIFSSILSGLPLPSAAKHSHCMILPPPCFPVGLVLAYW